MSNIETFYRVSNDTENIFTVTSFMLLDPNSKAMRNLISRIGYEKAMEGWKLAKEQLDPILTEENSVWKNESIGHMGAGTYAKGVAACLDIEDAEKILFALRKNDNRRLGIFEFEGVRISDVWNEGEGSDFEIPSCLVKPTKVIEKIGFPKKSFLYLGDRT